MPRKGKSFAVTTINLDEDIIEIDSDSDSDVAGERMLAGNVLCAEMKQVMANEPYGQPDNAAKYGETSRCSMQIVCADDSASGYEKNYKKYLDLLMKNEGSNLLEYNDRNSTSKLLRHNVVHNEKYDRTSSRAVKKQPRMSTRTVFKKKESQEKEGDVRCRRKPPVIEPISYIKDNLLYSFKDFKNVENRAGRDAKSQTLFSGSKILKTGTGRVNSKSISKTPPLVKTKDTLRKGEALRGRKNPVTMSNVKPKNSFQKYKPRKENEKRTKSTGYDKDNFFQTVKSRKENEKRTKSTSYDKDNNFFLRFKARKENEKRTKSTSYDKDNLLQPFKARKENEEGPVDDSYAYVLEYLNKSITSFGSKQLVMCEKDPVRFSDCDIQLMMCEKDLVGFSDCDIIAISSHPFSDGDISPFQGNKDHRVIDLEDGIAPEHIFNSSFSKKLTEILRQPYDKKEYMKLYGDASFQSPMTRTRELRSGSYVVYNLKELAPSYLDHYPDFKKKLRCYKEDHPIALNLLRGFFYYLQNVAHEEAFKPWLHKECFITYVV